MDVTHANAIFSTTTVHVRTAPIRNKFRYRSYSWFVDLDRLPAFPRWIRPLATFHASDHIGDPSKSIRQNIDAFLADQGIDLGGGRITMLASARVLGHTFNPLSVFWCHDREDRLVCVVAEVHNTYGERYAYLLHTDDVGAARARKEFYVSPFNDVSGEYRMKLPEPDSTLALSIVLEREGAPPFVASVTGHRRPATTRSVLASAVSVPLAPARVVAQIRWQGIRLWARGLPIVPRPKAPAVRKATR
ncbi:DUF1365 domain-containing protein [Rhodococcoides fascians]|uniref:DUF1365 domain-containing protein n=1 Tax=Rhodococcoides fascians TaxID=1828 RepID=UPI00055E905D|nr:DUF1365 domain-containing protein [Rhodococcus fascians]